MSNTNSETEPIHDEMSYETWNNDDMLMLDDVDLDAEFLEDCFDPNFFTRRKSEQSNFSNSSSEIKNLSATKSNKNNSNTYSLLDPGHSFTPDMFSPNDIKEDISCHAMNCDGTIELEKQTTLSEKPRNCSPDNATCDNTEFQMKYNRALSNLASSMERSQQSRAKILSRQDNQLSSTDNSSLGQPSPQTLSGLSRLLSGRSSTLTVALHQSRKQLKSYMDTMSASAQF